MPTIRPGKEILTVIVTVDASKEVLPDMEVHARNGLSWFAQYKGFISGALHRSEDGKRLVQYLQWTDLEAYLSCMNDAKWETLASTTVFMEHVRSGAAVIDVRAFKVVATIDNPKKH